MNKGPTISFVAVSLAATANRPRQLSLTVTTVDDKTFTIRDVRNCVARGHKELGFYEVDTGDANDYTIRLTDPVKESAGN